MFCAVFSTIGIVHKNGVLYMSDLYNRIFELCDMRGVKPGKMCADTGLSRGMMSDLKMGRTKELSAKNTRIIADYLGVSVDYLLGSEQEKTPILTKKDERDIGKRMEAMLEELESAQGDLMFSGEALDLGTKELLAASLRNSMQMGKLMAKQKFTPKKYKK